MNSDSFSFRPRDAAPYVSADKQHKHDGRSFWPVTPYSGRLYLQLLWIEDFAGQYVDTYSVSLANRIFYEKWSEKN
jgi:hypothetical protein